MSPLLVCLVIGVAITLAAWVASLITHEYSWVDRIWSIAPIVYVWVFAVAGGFTARLLLMAVLVTLWGARLTFNFARKGGYGRAARTTAGRCCARRMSPPQFAAFNLFFISIYQNAVILALTLPAFTVAEDGSLPLGRLGHRARGVLPRLPRRRDRRRPAAVGVPPVEGERAGRRPLAATGLPADRAVPVLAAPELLLRAGAVVGLLRFRGRGDWNMAALEHARRGAAHRAVHRLDDLHREHLEVEVPRVRRLSCAHFGARPMVSASSRGGG